MGCSKINTAYNQINLIIFQSYNCTFSVPNSVSIKKTAIRRKPMNENLFEEELIIETLSAMGNPLKLLSALVDFEMFHPESMNIQVKRDRKSTDELQGNDYIINPYHAPFTYQPADVMHK